MVTVNVLMLVNNVRLLSETELIKILARKYLKILVGEFIIGMRIEGYVKDRLLRLAHLGHTFPEIVNHI